MKYSFNITKESFREFKNSVCSEPKNKVLDRLKKQVEDKFEGGIIEPSVWIPVKIGSSIDAIFVLVYYTIKEDEVYFRYEFNGTCG